MTVKSDLLRSYIDFAELWGLIVRERVYSSGMTGTPSVSIIIPVYNGEKFLREAINSVLEQDYPSIELIILDDGSTDETRNILEEYKNKFYWETHPNMGQARTLNKGWRMSSGDVLGYLSADDCLLPGAVKKSVDCLMKEEEAVLTYGDYFLIDDESRIMRRVFAPEVDYHDMVVKAICPPGPGVFFRRSGFEKAGFWDPELKQVPDYDYWIRLGLHGRFRRIPEPLANFRVHEKSQSHAEPDEKRAEEIMGVMKRYFLLEGVPKDIQERRRRALSSASIVAARFHLRAGRYGSAISRLVEAFMLNPLSIVSREALMYMGNGLLYRLKRAARPPD